jgi:hypothetical protein
MTDEATTSNVNGINDGGNTGVINVGEHSAYKSVEDLVKGKAEADKYIAKLLAEAKAKDEMITNLTARANITEELKQIREANKMGTENTNTLEITEDAMKQIALKTMQEEAQRTTAQNNWENCKAAVATVNSDVELALKNKAQELGCTVEYLQGIAQTSPKAFKSMFGIKDAVSFDSVNFLQSTRQTSNETSNEDYSEMLKTANNPKVAADLFNRAMKDPSMLDKIKSW